MTTVRLGTKLARRSSSIEEMATRMIVRSRKADSQAADPHAPARLQLLDLAEDASLYLRRHAEPSVRVAAALLLASSLAACSSSPSASTASTLAPAVAPLAQEVTRAADRSGDVPDLC